MGVDLKLLVVNVSKTEMLGPVNKQSKAREILVSCSLGVHETAVASADRISRRRWAVDRVFVPPKYRSQGIGGALLHRLIRELLLIGQFRSLAVSFTGHNTEIRRLGRFYVRQGFIELRENQYVWQREGAATHQGEEVKASPRTNGLLRSASV